jgi:outer membrane biosynthesis protein TonB
MHEADTSKNGFADQERALRDEVERSERALEVLRQELDSVDEKLRELARRNPEYQMLANACRSLLELDNAGASDLFWDARVEREIREDQIRQAQHRLAAFENEIAEVEARRLDIVQCIGSQNDALDILNYDLADAIEQEERRKDEWLVEREIAELPQRAQIMPWARGCEEDQRFRMSLAASVVVGLLVGWLVSVVDLPIPERAKLLEVPERVAKLVREELALPQRPAEQQLVAEETPEPEPEPEPEEVEPVSEPVPEAKEPPRVAESPQPDSKERVKSKGILAFRDSISARAQEKMTARLGAAAKVGNTGDETVGRPERAMVTTTAPGSSGGINLASISRDVGGNGGQGIRDVEVGRVATSIGGGGGAGPDRPLSGGAMAGRTDEEIQIVFDRYKAALYRLYNRELRKDPTLRGQLVLRLTIEPDGSVSLCQLQSTDMNAPILSQQIVDRVSNFDFGAKDGIGAMTIIYPIDFLPAA